MAVLSAVIGVAPAGAHPSPPGCTSNSLDLVLGKDRTSVRNGEVITYTVSAQNTAGTPCLVTGVTITLTLPASNGTPTGQTVTLQTNQDYPAGAGLQVVGTVPYTVALDPGVTNAIVQASANGILHDNEPDDLAQITKTLGTTSTQPHLTLTESVTPTSGEAPLTVTHTYTVVNDSTTPVPIGSVSLTDTVCSNPVLTGGDANGNGYIDNGEAWTYVCTETQMQPGTFTSTATVTGVSTVDQGPVASAPVSASVTVTAPATGEGAPGSPTTPGNNNGNGSPSTPTRAQVLAHRLPGVNSRRARGGASCVSVPRRLTVRAGERTVVRVRVRRNGRGVRLALVRITGPGFVKKLVTNRRGFATFKVKPKRSGVLVIQSDKCAGADRLTVLSARRVNSGNVPQVTG